MKLKGLLLPVYALPSKYGIGEFSKEAFNLIDLLKENSFNAWQILPLNPVAYGHSPYQSYSSYAIEEAYISLDDLYSRELISKPIPFNENKKFVSYEEVIRLKRTYYLEAFFNFQNKYGLGQVKSFAEKNPKVLEYAKFVALKEINKGKPWNEWETINNDRVTLYTNFHLFLQMILFQEWTYIKNHAEDVGVKIIGDLPFYVGYDSADVYFNQDLFLLKDKKPTLVSGVGPDYFSKEGQLWGNPIYFYEAMYKDGYKFIIDRIINASNMYHMVRLDHFRAWDTYCVIPAEDVNARRGVWWEGPRTKFFDVLYEKYPNINLIAEDLGDLFQGVHDLRDHYNLPGMFVTQFMIMDENNISNDNQIVYPGTHDNQTLYGWIKSLSNEDKIKLKKRFKNSNIFESVAQFTWEIPSKMTIFPLQDILKLDDSSRMNLPGTTGSPNWEWKLKDNSYIDKIKFGL